MTPGSFQEDSADYRSLWNGPARSSHCIAGDKLPRRSAVIAILPGPWELAADRWDGGSFRWGAECAWICPPPGPSS
jgi:hypothetical protein